MNMSFFVCLSVSPCVEPPAQLPKPPPQRKQRPVYNCVFALFKDQPSASISYLPLANPKISTTVTSRRGARVSYDRVTVAVAVVACVCLPRGAFLFLVWANRLTTN